MRFSGVINRVKNGYDAHCVCIITNCYQDRNIAVIFNDKYSANLKYYKMNVTSAAKFHRDWHRKQKRKSLRRIQEWNSTYAWLNDPATQADQQMEMSMQG